MHRESAGEGQDITCLTGEKLDGDQMPDTGEEEAKQMSNESVLTEADGSCMRLGAPLGEKVNELLQREEKRLVLESVEATTFADME